MSNLPVNSASGSQQPEAAQGGLSSQPNQWTAQGGPSSQPNQWTAQGGPSSQPNQWTAQGGPSSQPNQWNAMNPDPTLFNATMYWNQYSGLFRPQQFPGMQVPHMGAQGSTSPIAFQMPSPHTMPHQPPIINIPSTPTNQGSECSNSVESMPAMPPRGTRTKVAAKRGKQENFKPEEDILLCQTWVEISSDSVVSTGQRKERLWDRIEKRYNERRGDNPARVHRSLSSRWDKIRPVVSKFTTYYARVLRQNQSGLNDHDMTMRAAAEWAKEEKYPFPYLHCWDILKNEPKWNQVPHETGHDPLTGFGGIPNIPSMDDGGTSSQPSSTSKRPVGRDSSKSSKKSKYEGTTESGEFISDLKMLAIDKYDAYKVTHDDKMKHWDTFIDIEKRKITVSEKMVEFKAYKDLKEKEKELLELLTTDMSSIPPQLWDYYEKKKQKLLEFLQSQ